MSLCFAFQQMWMIFKRGEPWVFSFCLRQAGQRRFSPGRQARMFIVELLNWESGSPTDRFFRATQVCFFRRIIERRRVGVRQEVVIPASDMGAQWMIRPELRTAGKARMTIGKNRLESRFLTFSIGCFSRLGSVPFFSRQELPILVHFVKSQICRILYIIHVKQSFFLFEICFAQSFSFLPPDNSPKPFYNFVFPSP